MTSTTLPGIFPEPKPVHKKNFVRENIKMLKRMQVTQRPAQNKVVSSKQVSNSPNDDDVVKKVKSHSQVLTIESRYKNTTNRNNVTRSEEATQVSKKALNNKPTTKTKTTLLANGRKNDTAPVINYDKSIQTDRTDVPKHHDFRLKRLVKTNFDTGGHGDGKVIESTRNNKIKTGNSNKKEKEDLKTYIVVPQEFQNLQTLNRTTPIIVPKQRDSISARHTRIKKIDKDEKARNDTQISNLVLLPDDERKEYLRVARENYAALIKELNLMPLRNDTLKRRNRKIEIDAELQRLDEVIKIFQKPKVFVKADS